MRSDALSNPPVPYPVDAFSGYSCVKYSFNPICIFGNFTHQHHQQNNPDPWANNRPSRRLRPTNSLAARKRSTICWKSFLSVWHKMSPQKQLMSKVLGTGILSGRAPHWVRCWVVFAVGHCCLSKLLQLSRRLEGFFSFSFCFFFPISAASRIVSGERESQAEAGSRTGESCAEMSAEVMIVENMHLILPGVSPS